MNMTIVELVLIIGRLLSSPWQKLQTYRNPTPDIHLSRRFKKAYPLIKEMADSTPPYADAKFGALQSELNFLKVYWPIEMQRWPLYLQELKHLSKKGNVHQARQITDYLDTTPR